jgi:predicted acylesterase/phospholipase RssA
MAFEKLAVDDNHKTLRLALAMRGGVSLAVWIGGAVAEIDLFRRACSNQIHPRENQYRQERARRYAELLRDTTEYERVEVDILAGASAGGLNAVLYGLAQSCRSVMDETVRDTWITNGGIWELLRETGLRAIRKNRRVPSLLQGDERLYTMARDALGTIAGQGSVPADNDRHEPLVYPTNDSDRPCTLAVELAATLLEDIYSPGRGNRASFSFRKTAASLASHFTTIPDREDALTVTGGIALDQMALAARSTSSFPGAFEPAKIYSATEHQEPSRRGLEVNMARVFPHARTQNANARNEPFNVVDGGIFDNIPIDRAIKAIRRAPASQPSERRLVYIDPEPPLERASATAPNQRVVTSWIPVIRSSMSLKKRSETASDELALILDHNDVVLLTRGRLEALAAALRRIENPSLASLHDLISEESYRQCRIALDANRIGNLLTDPWSELCQPPRRAVDYVALSPETVLGLKGQIADAYNNCGSDEVYPWSLSGDVYAMLDWVRLLIAWVHALEKLAGEPARQLSHLLSTWKPRLYRYLIVLIEAKHRTVDTVLTEPLKTSNPAEMRRNYQLRPKLVVSHAMQNALKLTGQLASLLRGEASPNSNTDKVFYDLLAQWRTLESAEFDFKATLRVDLDALRRQIVTQTFPIVLDIPLDGPQQWQIEWNESVYWHFYREPLVDFSIEDLSKVFAITGTPDTTSIIAFDQITSNAPPKFEIDTLRDAARAKHLGDWVRRPPTAEQAMAVLTDPRTVNGADAKLAGNVLSRFGGFFSARWRENDWQWGRLDAAAGIVQILQKVPKNSRTEPEAQLSMLEESTAYFQGSILRESKKTIKTPDDELAIAETVGAEGLDAISPHYRFALASRIVPLVFRASLPPSGSGASIAGAATRLGLLAARPLAVPVPLIADPLRLALSVVVVLSSAGLLGARNVTPFWQFVFAVTLMGLGAWIGYRAWKAGRRWRDVGTLLSRAADSGDTGSAPSEDIARWREIFDEANRKGWLGATWVLGIIAGGVGLYELVGLWRPLPLHGGIPVENALLALCVVAGLQHWFNQRSHRVSVAKKSSGLRAKARDFVAKLLADGMRSSQMSRVMRATVACVIAVAAVAGLILSSLIADENFEHLTRWPAAGYVAGVTVSVLVLISAWGWAHNGAAVGVAVTSGVIAAGAQWALDEYWSSSMGLDGLDLLPTLIWLLLMGLVMQYLPVRRTKAGETNTAYGEKDRPTITRLYTPAEPAGPVRGDQIAVGAGPGVW